MGLIYRDLLGEAAAMESVAVLSDIHGVLPALDAVLAEPAVRAADRIVLTGDIAAGPQPGEVLDRLTGLGDRVTWVRGNADRELVELARGETDDVGDPIAHWAAKQLGSEHVDRLAALPLSVLLDVGGFGPVLFCHATPRDDAEVVVVDSRLARWSEVPGGLPEEVMTVVCGHTHMPFARLANRRQIVNPGSVGMPYGRAGGALGAAVGRLGRAAADGLRRARRVRGGLRGVVLPGHRRVDRLLPALAGERRRRARGHGPARRPADGRRWTKRSRTALTAKAHLNGRDDRRGSGEPGFAAGAYSGAGSSHG
jgi:predicted phosphodiesterase